MCSREGALLLRGRLYVFDPSSESWRRLPLKRRKVLFDASVDVLEGGDIYSEGLVQINRFLVMTSRPEWYRHA